MPTFVQEPLVVGNTTDFILTARKDGVTWDLTSAVVTLTLWRPDGTTIGPLSATITNPTGGVAHHQVDETVLDSVGNWYRRWAVVQGLTKVRTRKKSFSVEP